MSKETRFQTSIVRKSTGRMLGRYLGEFANKVYHELTPAEQRKWRRIMIMHHGAAGVFVSYVGIDRNSPFLAALGEGLMESDLDDIEKWFKIKRSEK